MNHNYPGSVHNENNRVYFEPTVGFYRVNWIETGNNDIAKIEPIKIDQRDEPAVRAWSPSGGRVWIDIKPIDRRAGYWKVIPHDPDTILDGLQLEIVYLCTDGAHWYVYRPGEKGTSSPSEMTWIEPVYLAEEIN